MLKAHNIPIADTAAAFNRLYEKSARLPWDTDGPAPFVRDLVDQGAIQGDVLDAGCGTGENALYLAAQGFRVVAFDAAPAAIAKARAKAAQRGMDIALKVLDARRLPNWEPRFQTIIDSGLFHVMAKRADRRSYAQALSRVSAPGAMLHLLAFQATGPRWLTRAQTALRNALSGLGTHGVSRDEIDDSFSSGWSVVSIEQRRYGWANFLLARIRRV